MNTLEALKAQCKLICNTCYVDSDVLRLALINAGLDENAEPAPNDPAIIEAAILIVKGWVETSRSENGISVSIDKESLKNSILFWCGKAGLDASEYLNDITVLESGTELW